MKLLTQHTNYDETIQLALNMKENYSKKVLFHCYWYGSLNQKHLYSIKSCYFFNVYKNKHKIILWLENNQVNKYNEEIEKFAEIRYFDLKKEKNGTFLHTYSCNFTNITYYSDFIRTLLLYKYGGLWFDLDCFFLRSFDPIFFHYENHICVYQWENQFYPNNAIYISIKPYSDIMKKNIEFIINRNNGWGFQEAMLTFDLDLDMLVLPCSWFDADWIINSYNIGTNSFFEFTTKSYDFDNFFTGSFCYHWHNKWADNC